ncbi:MAG: hypothetical protein ACRC46_05275 [Thermoguttaceae bacterium]
MCIRMMSAVLVVCAGLAFATAQETKPVSPVSPAVGEAIKSRLDLEKADFGRAVNKELTTEKLRQRVPDGFASLVDKAQRAKVYQIQAEYHELIAALQARIVLLEKESLDKQEEVLTADQRVSLKKFRDELAAKRKKSASKTDAAGATDGAEGAEK